MTDHTQDPQVALALDYLAPFGDEYEYTRNYVTCTGIIPDWLKVKMDGPNSAKFNEFFHKYIVEHRGKEYPVAAKSEAQAVNLVRFRIYGTRPAASLPPFTARLADGVRTMTRKDGTNGRLSLSELQRRVRAMA